MRSSPTALKRWLFRIADRFAGVFGASLHRKIDVFDLQRRLLGQPAAVVFDVGAATGTVAQRYRALFGEARIVCFEPDHARAARIVDLGLGWVDVVNLALSDSEGTARFHVNASPDTSSLLPSRRLGNRIDTLTSPASVTVVQTTTLDAYCERSGIDRIDILKMDIQGGELAALRGATSLLSSRRIRLIYLEVEFVEIYENQPLFHQVAGFLGKYGYELYGIYDMCWMERDRLGWGDAIFVPGEPQSVQEP